MRFVRNAAIPVILIAAIALLAGCSKEPTLAIQDAEASLGKLQAAGAAHCRRTPVRRTAALARFSWRS